MAQGIHSLARGPKIEISGNWGQMRRSADEHADHPKAFDEEAEVQNRGGRKQTKEVN